MSQTRAKRVAVGADRRIGIRDLILCAFALALATAIPLSPIQAEGPAPIGDERLSFEDRVRHQRAIEEVYWRHRIWPAENPGTKPALQEVLSETRIRERVATYLVKSAALEFLWSHSLIGDPLQAELDRMVSGTRNPDLLRELFAALDDDPFLVAECLARPLLADRLIRDRYDRDDRFERAPQRQDRIGVSSAFSGTADETRSATEPRSKLPFDTWWTQEGRALANSGGGRRAVAIRPYRYELRFPLGGGCDLDSWMPTADSPSARDHHTAVWTGAEMIVWGGWNEGMTLNEGGRYDPATDSWTATSTVPGAPSPRYLHTAVWTGTEMIVWGGDVNPSGNYTLVRTGGRYNPTSDDWTATSLGTECPEERVHHSAIWTGTEMIVWGGARGFSLYRNTGARYDPVADVWSATSTGPGTPEKRGYHTAVWTGAEMIIWGGVYSGRSGARYDPSIDAWTEITFGPGTPPRMSSHRAVWTGSEMIVYGGFGSSYQSGRYDPLTDTWVEMSADGVPEADMAHTVVWTGSEMIVWGGYNPTSNAGGRYDPLTDTWAETSTAGGVPTGRYYHTAVWTGAEMIVWGGYDGDNLDTGGSYCACSGGPVSTWYPDADGDTLGADTTAIPACAQPPGYIASGGDCDDRYFDCTTDCTDADLDGLPACAADCDDTNPNCTTDCTDNDADDFCVTTDCDDQIASCTVDCTDADMDGLYVCAGDCDDANPNCTTDCTDADGDSFCVTADCDDQSAACNVDCSDPDEDLVADCKDNCPGIYNPTQTDADADGWGGAVGCDCDDSDPDTYPDAPEIHDGLDNQCPGYVGYGLIDEITGICEFDNPERLSWPEQPGATDYQVARTTDPESSTDCLLADTTDTYWVDSDPVPLGVIFHYLVRSTQPFVGSWGANSEGVERAGVCP